MSGQTPLVVTRESDPPLAAASANADASGCYVEAPFDGTVSNVQITPATTVTGANTDSRTIEVRNRKQDGSGNVLVASKAFTSGVNATADTETVITLTATAADLVVAKGDILEVNSLHVGSTGLAGPAARVQVEFTRS